VPSRIKHKYVANTIQISLSLSRFRSVVADLFDIHLWKKERTSCPCRSNKRVNLSIGLFPYL
jgi:hypothetical protein